MHKLYILHVYTNSHLWPTKITLNYPIDVYWHHTCVGMTLFHIQI